MLIPYVQLLALVARADGIIDPNEVEAIRHAARRVGLDEGGSNIVDRLLNVNQPVDVERTLQSATSELINEKAGLEARAALLGEILRDCYVMAAIDGDISLPEVRLIDQVMEAAKVPVPRRPTLHH